MAQIEDFGQKIEGARKDAHSRWLERMGASAVQTPGENEKLNPGLPFSVMWPEPDYTKLASMEASAWIRALRDELLKKPGPRQGLATWVMCAEIYLEAAKRVLATAVRDPGNFSFFDAERIAKESVAQTGQNYPVRVQSIVTKGLDGVAGRAHAYEMLGHAVSLRDARFSVGRAPLAGGGAPGTCRIDYWRGARHVDPYFGGSWDEVIRTFANEDKHYQSLLNQDGGGGVSPKKKKGVKISGVSFPGDPRYYLAAKQGRNWVRLASFESVAALREKARDAEYLDELSQRFEQWRAARIEERGEGNRARVGIDWRAGEDVTVEQFAQAFGFRGVQFGNYVEGPRRQADLNNAYDALMDLAQVLDVPARTLSLDGTLGLAFGARGKGGVRAAAAHYEPTNQVINLTKTSGAGSLAHEWFHALDHFVYQRVVGPGLYPGGVMATDASAVLRDLSFAQGTLDASKAALAAICKQLGPRSKRLDLRRSKPYWSLIHERAARAFEASVKYAIDSAGNSNDYLANITSETEWIERNVSLAIDDANEAIAQALEDYPYPLASEIEAVSRDMLTLASHYVAVVPGADQPFDGRGQDECDEEFSLVGERMADMKFRVKA